LIDDLLYMVSSVGIASCVEAETGNLVWQERIGGAYSASPLYAGGRIYFFNHEGTATIVQPGRKFTVVAVNKLDGEDVMASRPSPGMPCLCGRGRTSTGLKNASESGWRAVVLAVA